MQSVCRKLMEQRLEKTKMFEQDIPNQTQDSLFQIIEQILQRERFKAAWLQSPYLFEDLEMIYSLHLITKTEWQEQLEVLYHPLLEKTELNKVRFEKNYRDIEEKFEER